VLLEQRVGGEVGGVTSCGEDDGTHLGILHDQLSCSLSLCREPASLRASPGTRSRHP
jgi:hypothetical protein